MTVGDIIVIAVLLCVIGLIVRGMIRDKKQGKCCGCSGCSGCAGKCDGCSAACNYSCAQKEENSQ